MDKRDCTAHQVHVVLDDNKVVEYNMIAEAHYPASIANWLQQNFEKKLC